MSATRGGSGPRQRHAVPTPADTRVEAAGRTGIGDPRRDRMPIARQTAAEWRDIAAIPRTGRTQRRQVVQAHAIAS